MLLLIYYVIAFSQNTNFQDKPWELNDLRRFSVSKNTYKKNRELFIWGRKVASK